jgi:hypothetical protein
MNLFFTKVTLRVILKSLIPVFINQISVALHKSGIYSEIKSVINFIFFHSLIAALFSFLIIDFGNRYIRLNYEAYISFFSMKQKFSII